MSRVKVYFNLHKRIFSLLAMDGPSKGRVVGHEQVVYLRDVEPRVSEAGRQRVLRERRKNVHAGLVGDWITPQEPMCNLLPHVLHYNPYETSAFVTSDRYDDRGWPLTGCPPAAVLRADAALLVVSRGKPNVLVFNPQLMETA